MVRTKQTAKESTGGTAPCVLYPLSAVPSIQDIDSSHVNLPSQLQPEEPGVDVCGTRPSLMALFSLGQPQEPYDDNDDVSTPSAHPSRAVSPLKFCHMCMDGGELWRCDLCIRSECKGCIVVPPEHLAIVEPKEVKLLCLSCHLMDDAKTKTTMPYMVSMHHRCLSLAWVQPHVIGILSGQKTCPPSTTACARSI